MAFTPGDPAGLGPEAVIGALRSRRLGRACRALLIGEPSVWKRAGWRPGLAPLLDTRLGLRPPPYGAPTADGGRLSFAALRLAVRLSCRRVVSGIVTAPISKRAWAMAGIPFTDHTEYLKEETGRQTQMLLGVPRRRIWCILATRHIPLSRASAALSAPIVSVAAAALGGALKTLGFSRPRLGLCAFNPHAGEDGILGSEESRILGPAVVRARKQGVRLEGPIPADTAWRRHLEGGLDGLVCLYHDQALIPLKAAAGLSAVNWTAGIPFARTSPAHGTGYDIAGSGRVDPSATIAAAELAAVLSRNS